MTSELISVIVPCYNASKYLDDLLASFGAQTYKNVEYIFVDDGSSDDTVDKLHFLVAKNKLNAKIIAQQNSGPSIARNKGLALATGSLVYFCDSDDFLESNALFVLERIINENNADLGCFHSKHVNNNYRFENKVTNIDTTKVKITQSKENIVNLLLSSKKEIGYGVFNHIYRMSILKQIPEFPNVFNPDCYFAEDLLMNLKYCSKCNKSVFINKVLYHIRLSKNSLVRSKFNAKKLTAFKVEEYFNTLDQNTFISSIPYMKTYVCFTCMDFLLQIAKSDFDNVATINNLYKQFKDNLKYCKLGKLTPWYRKYFMWVTVPIVKIAIRKKIKK